MIIIKNYLNGANTKFTEANEQMNDSSPLPTTVAPLSETQKTLDVSNSAFFTTPIIYSFLSYCIFFREGIKIAIPYKSF